MNAAQTLARTEKWTPNEAEHKQFSEAIEKLKQATTEIKAVVTTLAAATDHAKRVCTATPIYLLQITALQAQMSLDQAQTAINTLKMAATLATSAADSAINGAAAASIFDRMIAPLDQVEHEEAA